MLLFKLMLAEKLIYGVIGWMGKRMDQSARFQENQRSFQEFIDEKQEEENFLLAKSLEYPTLTDLLLRPRERFEIGNILYPGCGADIFSLEEAFEPDEVFYMDRDRQSLLELSTFLNSAGANIVHENVLDSHFPDGYFDAVFIKDFHHENKDYLTPILRMLKPGGVLIHSNYDNGCLWDEMIGLDEFKRAPNLKMFPLTQVHYSVFQKVA